MVNALWGHGISISFPLSMPHPPPLHLPIRLIWSSLVNHIKLRITIKAVNLPLSSHQFTPFTVQSDMWKYHSVWHCSHKKISFNLPIYLWLNLGYFLISIIDRSQSYWQAFKIQFHLFSVIRLACCLTLTNQTSCRYHPKSRNNNQKNRQIYFLKFFFFLSTLAHP